MGSLGLGPARRTETREDRAAEPSDPKDPEPSEDNCWFCYDTRRTTSTEIGVLLEGGVLVRVWKLEFGGTLRLDFAADTTVVTLGPSVGFEF